MTNHERYRRAAELVQPVPERNWSEPYMIRFDSEFGDKEAMEGSDIHALHFLRKTSVTPITVDMTKR